MLDCEGLGHKRPCTMLRMRGPAVQARRSSHIVLCLTPHSVHSTTPTTSPIASIQAAPISITNPEAPLRYGGYCTRCGSEHYLHATPQAYAAAAELAQRIHAEGRLDWDVAEGAAAAADPRFSEAYLWTKGPGRMMGVLLTSRREERGTSQPAANSGCSRRRSSSCSSNDTASCDGSSSSSSSSSQDCSTQQATAHATAPAGMSSQERSLSSTNPGGSAIYGTTHATIANSSTSSNNNNNSSSLQPSLPAHEPLILRAFSGQLTETWHVPGWAGPVGHLTNDTELYRRFRSRTEALSGLLADTQAVLTKLRGPMPTNRKQRRALTATTNATQGVNQDSASSSIESKGSGVAQDARAVHAEDSMEEDVNDIPELAGLPLVRDFPPLESILAELAPEATSEPASSDAVSRTEDTRLTGEVVPLACPFALGQIQQQQQQDLGLPQQQTQALEKQKQQSEKQQQQQQAVAALELRVVAIKSARRVVSHRLLTHIQRSYAPIGFTGEPVPLLDVYRAWEHAHKAADSAASRMHAATRAASLAAAAAAAARTVPFASIGACASRGNHDGTDTGSSCDTGRDASTAEHASSISSSRQLGGTAAAEGTYGLYGGAGSTAASGSYVQAERYDSNSKFEGFPAGTGDCCAPKLLAAAAAAGLIPQSLVEFWYGSPPNTATAQGRSTPVDACGITRQHLQAYGPCPKCQTILGTMLCGLDV